MPAKTNRVGWRNDNNLNSTIMKILWAEKMANKVKDGSYEHFTDDSDGKMMIRIYFNGTLGISSLSLKKILRMKPRNFTFVGIYWCPIEKKMHLSFYER